MIGINYTGTSHELGGCINDSENLKIMLMSKGYFKEEDIIMMNDNQEGKLYPTKENIMNQFRELVKFADDNADKQINIFLSYSGHGYYLPDDNGDEDDGRDEVLCPIDCDDNGYIRDDTIKSIFVDRLGPNVNLVSMIDACHSGTIIDFDDTYSVWS